MQPRTATRCGEWEIRPTDEGYAGLQALAESGFSGVATASDVIVFMLNGRAVGLTDGSIGAFEGASFIARESPHPALPLLFAMEERGGTTQATYYTNDTSIEKAAATLESGGFTGYIELSENVLSGEYFLVFHQGRSMCVAFVGSEERLLTDDEARARLRKEVGVYTVESIDISELSIPEPAADTAGSSGPLTDAETTLPTTDPEPTASGEPAADSAFESDAVPSSESDADSTTGERPPTEINTPIEPTDPAPPTATKASESTGTTAPSEPADSSDPREPTDPRERWGSVIDDPVEDRIAAERQWRETNRIPSIDPERSALADAGSVTVTREPEPAESSPRPGEELLSRALDALETERAAREETETTVAELRGEIARLEDQLMAMEEADSAPAVAATIETETETGPEAEADAMAGSAPGRSIDPETALSGTNLFVRYDSQGDTTLEAAHAGEADREALGENLLLERRTEFDSSTVAVEGEPFEAFLPARPEYRFAEWLVRDLPFEIRETGHSNSMKALYDALPTIDRIEFRGAIEGETDGERPEDENSHRFDVICRDRMSEVLFVTNCVDARAAGEERVATLVESASEITGVASDLAGAMIVTTSYFDPDALSTAGEATRSGLLGGGSRASYVTLSRRSGYHLCLIEMHEGNFHITVPEL